MFKRDAKYSTNVDIDLVDRESKTAPRGCSTSNPNYKYEKVSQKQTEPDFLEAVRLLKTELMEAMDKKLNYVLMHQSPFLPRTWERTMQPQVGEFPLTTRQNVVPSQQRMMAPPIHQPNLQQYQHPPMRQY